MSKNIDPWELLEKARVVVGAVAESGNADWELLHRIDAALDARKADGRQTCEFCKGVGHVPYKKPWSPKDVLGGSNE